MATYTSVSAIQSEFKSISFGTSTPISTTDVEEFITQEETALELSVGAVYSIPVTGTRAISIMKLMATLMVKARILDIITVKSGDKNTEQESPGQALRDRVKAMLEDIKTKKVVLSDATLVESSAGVKSYTSSNDLTQVFKREEDQW